MRRSVGCVSFRWRLQSAAHRGFSIRVEHVAVAGNRVGEKDDGNGAVLSERTAVNGVLDVGAALAITRHVAGDGVLNGVAIGESLGGLIRGIGREGRTGDDLTEVNTETERPAGAVWMKAMWTAGRRGRRWAAGLRKSDGAGEQCGQDCKRCFSHSCSPCLA